MHNRQTSVWGDQHANSQSYEVRFDIPDSVARCSCKSCSDQHAGRHSAGFSHALHGRTGAQRGRHVARSLEIGARPIVEGLCTKVF